MERIVINSSKDLTEDMILFFYQRTSAHIERVRTLGEHILPTVIRKGDKDKFKLAYITHDASKISIEERIPYIMFSWVRKNPDQYTLGADADRDFQKAWIHHYKHNDHHPEFWGEALFPTLSVDELPRFRIAMYHMLCDCGAMSWEFKNSLGEWIQKNFLDKWKCHPSVVELVQQTVPVIEGFIKPLIEE